MNDLKIGGSQANEELNASVENSDVLIHVYDNCNYSAAGKRLNKEEAKELYDYIGEFLCVDIMQDPTAKKYPNEGTRAFLQIGSESVEVKGLEGISAEGGAYNDVDILVNQLASNTEELENLVKNESEFIFRTEYPDLTTDEELFTSLRILGGAIRLSRCPFELAQKNADQTEGATVELRVL